MPTSTLSSSPSSGVSTPLMKPYRHISSPAVPFSIQSSNAKANRWSMQSNTTASTYLSSMASSPRSYLDRGNSLFDRLEAEEEISRPTSPDSLCISSPVPFKRRDRLNGQSLSTFEEEALTIENEGFPVEAQMHDESSLTEVLHFESNEPGEDERPINRELTPKPSMALQTSRPEKVGPSPTTILQEFIETPDLDTTGSSTLESYKSSGKLTEDRSVQFQDTDYNDHDPENQHSQQYFQTYTDLDDFRPSLRRSNSHESLVSISGMDIHLAQHNNRPGHGYSALTLLRTSGANKHHFAPSPASARKVSTTQPVAAITEYTAMSRPGLDHQPSASMLALSGIARSTVPYDSSNSGNRGLIGSVGGWVSRKWGATPTKGTLPPLTQRSTTAVVAADAAATSTTTADTPFTPVPARSNTAFLPRTQSTPATMLKHCATTDSISTSSASMKSASTKRSANTDSAASSSNKPASVSAVADHQQARPKQNSMSSSSASAAAASMFMRNPGINQFGPIPGFAAAVAARKAPTEIEAKEVNLSGLQESLAGG